MALSKASHKLVRKFLEECAKSAHNELADAEIKRKKIDEDDDEGYELAKEIRESYKNKLIPIKAVRDVVDYYTREVEEKAFTADVFILEGSKNSDGGIESISVFYKGNGVDYYSLQLLCELKQKVSNSCNIKFQYGYVMIQFY